MKRALIALAILAPLSAHAIPANQGEASISANAWPLRVTDGTHDLTLLNSAPGSDTGQVAVPVRILSGLSLNVTGALTDTQLRASPVPVSGTFWQTTQPVSGAFWQTTQPVSAASLPLPSGASTESTLALIKAKTDNLDVALSTRTKPADTQTVSGTVTANAGSGTFAVSGPLTDAQLRASAVPVSGTFYQATQPVSGTVAVSGTVPVSGTFWQATQPVSGTVTANQGGTWTVQPGNTANTTAWKVDGSAVTQPVSGTFWQATQPVSGTFWQATQPVSGTVTANAGSGTMAVSGPLTDTQLRASAVPVSGTFFQATQPVSGTVTANAGSGTMAVSGPLTDTQLRATAVPVSGTFFQATQPVSGTVTANAGGGTMAVSGTFWQATQPVSGTVTANAAQSGTWTVQPGNTANTTAWKVDGSAVTQPVSGTVAATESGTWTVQPGNTANSTPWLTTDSATSATASAVPAKASYVGANVLALGAAPTAVSAGNLAGLAVDTQNRLLVNNFHPNLIVCNLLTTNATSTSLAGSCAAPGAAKSVYITDISIGGGVATSATAPVIIQTGTGGTCGTGTTVLYRCNHGATTGCEAHFTTPIKAAANSEVCILDGVTGTKSVTAQGFIAP